MGETRKIWIWIGIVAVIGLALVLVACETGALLPQAQNNLENGTKSHGSGSESAVGPQGNGNAEQLTGNTPESITAGKPYSVKLIGEDTKNVLIIGEDKASDNYDTIGIASIDRNNKTLKLIMIPRDTYIEYNRSIIASLEEKKMAKTPGIYKINAAHLVGKIAGYSGKFDSGQVSFLAEVIREKFGIPVDDYIKINTKGFRALVDYLGGADISVPYDMNYEDPTQDLSIHIPKGLQHLDGTEAEGFVRFRQGYREDGTWFEIGDPGRKKNQLTFIKELIKQKGTLANIGKIPGILDILGKNVQHSIGLDEILQTYIGLAKYIVSEEYEISTENLNSDKLIRIDGSSYMVFD